MPYVVQLPHPGPEHNPGNRDIQPWNVRDHGRKFLRSSGRYVARNGRPREAELVFWGEWEPPSRIIERWEREHSLPRFLHEPVWQHLPPGQQPQNTDPWVFGNSFRYSNCRQASSPALQRLEPGSVILFGSTIAGEFVIDTVFVVKDDGKKFCPNNPPRTDEGFRICVVESLRATDGNTSFTLYRGATYEDRINGMFSFVPCRRADAPELRFPRPPIQLDGYINPNSWRGPRVIPASQTDVRQQWTRVRKQVLDADCLLGISFPTPPLDNALANPPPDNPRGGRGCYARRGATSIASIPTVGASWKLTLALNDERLAQRLTHRQSFSYRNIR